MVSLRSALSAVAMAVSTAAITVNVYSDGDCTQYATSFNPVENGCYNWDWEGSNSDLVTDWLNGCKNCVCRFYKQPNCEGTTAGQSATRDGQCVSSGGGFKSVFCLNPAHI
jgi:hypothetical protein